MTFFIIISAVELLLILCLGALLYKAKKKITIQDTIKDEMPNPTWSTALHDKCCDKWITVFSGMKYPIAEEEKAQIVSLLWEISSTTIDCLMYNSNDTNLLQRHRDSVAFLTGETSKWENLKEFRRDPSTVPCQAIAIYDILKELGVKGEFVAFGYKMILD